MDFSTEPGAKEIAKTIRTFWRKRGFDVAPDVVAESAPDGAKGATRAMFVVRSNMRGGMPRGCRMADLSAPQ